MRKTRRVPSLKPRPSRIRAAGSCGWAPATRQILLTLLSRPVLGVNVRPPPRSGRSLHSSHSPQITSCSRAVTCRHGRRPLRGPIRTRKRPRTGHGWDATPFHCTTTGFNGTIFSAQGDAHVMNLADDGAARSVGRYCAARSECPSSRTTGADVETTVRNIWNAYVVAPKTITSPRPGSNGARRRSSRTSSRRWSSAPAPLALSQQRFR